MIPADHWAAYFPALQMLVEYRVAGLELLLSSVCSSCFSALPTVHLSMQVAQEGSKTVGDGSILPAASQKHCHHPLKACCSACNHSQSCCIYEHPQPQLKFYAVNLDFALDRIRCRHRMAVSAILPQ